MKFTYSWLKDYLDTDADAEKITTALTNIGLELEYAEDLGANLADFVVAKIESADKHPDADKLQICQVFDGQQTRQIVCGAANARAGIYVVLAKEGVCIPSGNFTIKKATIRGVESNGMLCSFEELGIAGDSDGIIELTGSPIPGSAAAEALGLNDVVIDIAITPNRGDCFGVYGIARDLAAAGFGTLKAPTIKQIDVHNLGSNTSKITVGADSPLCSEFVGITISGVKNGPSPAWLKQRLEMVGQKSISALVDITNYILITFGRPLHAYDTRFLEGHIVAREAKAGETFTALNEIEYTLEEGMLVIADDKKILGLAGIMGGQHSGCKDDTTEVFIESALFDAISIAQTGQKLNLTSDARMRFERGVDSAFAMQGAELAAQMILDICGGEASKFVTAQNGTVEKIALNFNPNLVGQLTSLQISPADSDKILNALGFSIDKNDTLWHVTAPSWRHDIGVAEDLVEEVARIIGYDSIQPISLPKAQATATPKQDITEERMAICRKLLAAQGMIELQNWTFVSESQAQETGELNPSLRLANPISSELSVMRSSLLPHMLQTAQRNLNKGAKNIAVFEAGQVFDGPGYADQHQMVACLLTGNQTLYAYKKEQFSASEHHYSVFDAKAAAFSLLANLGVNVQQLMLTRDTPDYYHPGRSMRVSLGGKVTLAYVGELYPTLAGKYDISTPAAYVEILLDNIPTTKQKGTAKKPLTISPYPAVDRDFAFTVDEAIEVEQLQKAALKADKKLIKSAEIFDVYQGEHMEAGKKSVALRVTLESAEKTLTDEEIGQVADAVIRQVTTATGAQLRQ